MFIIKEGRCKITEKETHVAWNLLFVPSTSESIAAPSLKDLGCSAVDS